MSAGYRRNSNGNIASLPVRRRYGYIHRSAVHRVFGDYLIVAGRFVFVKAVVLIQFRADGRGFHRISVRTGRASEPHTRTGVQRTYFARYFFVDFGRYSLQIPYVRQTS